MVSELAVWQEVLLVGLALLSLLYVFYFKIWITLAVASDVVFAVALAIAVASVAVPAAFELSARALVDLSSLPRALASADEKVAEIEALPSRLIARALEKLGVEPEPVAPEAIPVDPRPGPFEAQIRPSAEALVAVVLRTASFFIATLTLLMALSLRSSTSTARALQNLSRRTEALEARRVAVLDSNSTSSRRGSSPAS